MKENLGQGVSVEMVLIPAGKFMMGSPESEFGRFPDESQYEVTLTNPYYMGKYAVTQEQWELVMGDNPSWFKGAKLPVTDVSWEDCEEFVKKLNAKTNGGYRLPTEAEWEYACRAGTTTAYSFGDKITLKDANYSGSTIDAPAVIGSYKPNAFGLYDMHGNVNEWTSDFYGSYPWGCVSDPKRQTNGKYRVVRGGTYTVYTLGTRSSIRFKKEQNKKHFDIGFRLARNK